MINFFNAKAQRRKRVIFFVLFVPFVVPFLALMALRAEAQETAVSPFQASATANFGQSLQFQLTGSDHPAVIEATLFFTFPTAERIYVRQVRLDDPLRLDLTERIGLQEEAFGLRPFAPITYWWELETDAGLLVLPEQVLLYEDNQLAWQVSELPLVTVHALPNEQGETPLAAQAQEIVAEVLPQLAQQTGLTLTTPLPLYIYPSTADFQRMADLADYVPPTRIVTGADLGVLLQTAVNPRTASQDLARELPRELVRLAVVRQTGRPYAELPAWVVEGLVGLVAEKDGARLLLETAVVEEQTTPLDALCEVEQFVENEPLASVQSAALLRYLTEQYGTGVLAILLSELSEGANCATLISGTLNISNADLTQEWLDRQQSQLNDYQTLRDNTVWLLLLLGSTLLLIASRLRPR